MAAQWEYKLAAGTQTNLEKRLNDLAEQGWEPIGVGISDTGMGCLLRRPVDPNAPKREERGSVT